MIFDIIEMCFSHLVRKQRLLPQARACSAAFFYYFLRRSFSDLSVKICEAQFRC